MDAFLGFLVLVGIVIVWINIKRKRTRPRKTYSKASAHRESTLDNHMRAYDAYSRVSEKYKRVTDSHFALTEKIVVAYTVASNIKASSSREMDEVIRLCEQDIALAPEFRKYCQEVNATGYYGGANAFTIRSYPSFKRLAIIYEKQKKYDKAIEVCKQAIALGFPDDGTEGQMAGRIARLMKKRDA